MDDGIVCRLDGFVFAARLFCLQGGGGVEHGADDAGIGGAATDVSGEGGFDIVFRGIGVAVKKSFGGDEPAGGAEAAVGRDADVADALERVQRRG